MPSLLEEPRRNSSDHDQLEPVLLVLQQLLRLPFKDESLYQFRPVYWLSELSWHHPAPPIVDEGAECYLDLPC
jgi:hypothetical protein